MNLYYQSNISNSLFNNSQQLNSHCELYSYGQTFQTRRRQGRRFLFNEIDQIQSQKKSSSERSNIEEEHHNNEQLKQLKQAAAKEDKEKKSSQVRQPELSYSFDNNYYNSSSARKFSPLINISLQEETVTPGEKQNKNEAQIDFTKETHTLNLINQIMNANFLSTPENQLYTCGICKLKLQKKHFEGSDCEQVKKEKFCFECLTKKVESQIKNNNAPKCFCEKNILPNSLLAQSLNTSYQKQLLIILVKELQDKSQISGAPKQEIAHESEIDSDHIQSNCCIICSKKIDSEKKGEQFPSCFCQKKMLNSQLTTQPSKLINKIQQKEDVARSQTCFQCKEKFDLYQRGEQCTNCKQEKCECIQHIRQQNICPKCWNNQKKVSPKKQQNRNCFSRICERCCSIF